MSTTMAAKGLKAKRQSGLVAVMTMIRLGWTQGAFCRDVAGSPVPPGSDRVARVDLAYALSRCALSHGLPEDDLRDLVQPHLSQPYRRDQFFGVERWNDREGRTRTEVIYLLERTISGL